MIGKPFLSTILVILLAIVVQGHSFYFNTLSLSTKSTNIPLNHLSQVKDSKLGDRPQRHYPTYSPGGTDMSGVTIHRIRSASAPSPLENKSGVEIDLSNSTGRWYIGGWEWVLWIGDAKSMRGSCSTGMQGKSLGTACFRFSMEQWKKFNQGDSLILTWGFDKERRDQTLPFARLDKKLLNKKPKHQLRF